MHFTYHNYSIISLISNPSIKSSTTSVISVSYNIVTQQIDLINQRIYTTREHMDKQHKVHL